VYISSYFSTLPDFITRFIAGAAAPHDLPLPCIQRPQAVHRHEQIRLLRPAVDHLAVWICKATHAVGSYTNKKGDQDLGRGTATAMLKLSTSHSSQIKVTAGARVLLTGYNRSPTIWLYSWPK
jgi:hypothetical protein